MASWIQLAVLTSAVILFYILAWFGWGRDPQPGTIVAKYEPPRGLSAGFMRYVWKQRFDERVVWSGVLSLVSRGLAVLEKTDDGTFIKPVWPPRRNPSLPKEELALYRDLTTARGRKGVRLSLLDECMARMAVQMAATLRVTQQGLWFLDNRKVVLAGSVLSGTVLLIAAKPDSIDRLLALLIPAPLMAIGAFYGYFLTQRILELLRVAREHVQISILRRLILMILVAVPSTAAIVLAAIVFYVDFGPELLFAAAILTFVNLIFLYLMKAPTRQGRKLLDEIEGFRHFLAMVEHLPMDLPDAPNVKPGLYEKYLPYALALEVEQEWCDQTAAIASSDHEISELGEGEHIFQIGMREGRPIEIAYHPKARGHGW